MRRIGEQNGKSELQRELSWFLIAYLMLRLAQATQKVVHSPLEFTRLVRANLMHRRPIDRLLEPLQPVNPNPNQLKLGLYFP